MFTTQISLSTTHLLTYIYYLQKKKKKKKENVE